MADEQKICTRCHKPHKRASNWCYQCAYDPKPTPAQKQRAKAEKKEKEAAAQQREVDQEALVTGRKSMFLTELAENGGHVEHACRAAGVSRVMMGRYRDEDPEFATAWETIQEYNVEKLEREVDRRAFGYEEPVVYQGKVQGMWVGPDGQPSAPGEWGAIFVPTTITKFSDNLLMFRLKALRPERYRDGAALTKKASDFTEDELNEELTKMMARRAKSNKPDEAEGVM